MKPEYAVGICPHCSEEALIYETTDQLKGCCHCLHEKDYWPYALIAIRPITANSGHKWVTSVYTNRGKTGAELWGHANNFEFDYVEEIGQN